MFPDFPFDTHLPSFVPHQDVQNYLERYSTNFGITPHIKVSSKNQLYILFPFIYSNGIKHCQKHLQMKCKYEM